MVEMFLIGVMTVSVVGMVVSEMNDPLSRKFWNDMMEILNKRTTHGRDARVRKKKKEIIWK